MLIRDSHGKTTHYGRVLKPTSESGTVDITVPSGLTNGLYTLYVFSEQYNGDYKTDYASALDGLTLTIHEHSWSADWHTDETALWHDCTVAWCPITEDCDKDGYKNHTGSKTVCTERAVCDICNRRYGDPVPHELTHIDAKVATAAEVGNTEYWHCNVCNKYFSDENGANEIALTETVISKLAPKIITGDGAAVTQGEKKTLSFTSDAAFDDFLRVEVNGIALDNTKYTVKSGSTVVTLNADYVSTLSVGEHTLGIVIQSGTATAKFIVSKKTEEVTNAETTTTPSNGATMPSSNETTMTQNSKTETTDSTQNNNKKSPQTGNTSNLALWLALLLASDGAIISTTVVGRKRKYNK